MNQLDVLRCARKKLYILKEVYDLGGTAKELLDETDGQLFLLEELMTGALPDPKYKDILTGSWGEDHEV